MAAPRDTYPLTIAEVIRARIDGHGRKAARLMASIRAETPPHGTGKPGRALKARIYERDHYQCRYCGRKVILTPVMRLLSRLYPEDFPYDSHWRVDSTHPAFLLSSATLDHVVAVAAGGCAVDEENLVTACWSCNRLKGDLSLDDLGWALVEPTDPSWSGLSEMFYPLWVSAGRPELSTAEAWWLKATRATGPSGR